MGKIRNDRLTQNNAELNTRATHRRECRSEIHRSIRPKHKTNTRTTHRRECRSNTSRHKPTTQDNYPRACLRGCRAGIRSQREGACSASTWAFRSGIRHSIRPQHKTIIRARVCGDVDARQTPVHASPGVTVGNTSRHMPENARHLPVRASAGMSGRNTIAAGGACSASTRAFRSEDIAARARNARQHPCNASAGVSVGKSNPMKIQPRETP